MVCDAFPLSHLLVQVDIWPSSGNGTFDNVTFTVIAQHTVKGVTSISQVSSEQHALQWSPFKSDSPHFP